MNLDPVLAEDILADMKRKQGITGTSYSKSFEADFWNTYQKSHNANRTQQGVSRPIPEGARDNVIGGAVRALVAKQGTFYIPGQMDEVAAKDLPGELSDWVDEKTGKYRQDVYGRLVEPGPGFKSSGTLITNNKGQSIVVVDQNVERQGLSKALAGGLNPIFNGRSRKGAPIPYGQREDGSWATGEPFIYHRDNGDGLYMKNFGIINSNNDILEADLFQLYDNITPLIEEQLGKGATKADATPFKF